MDSKVVKWRIRFIRADAWESRGDKAYVEASNYAGNSCSFTLVLISESQPVVVNFSSSSYEQLLLEKLSGFSIQDLVVPLAENMLKKWNKEIQIIVELLPKGRWKKGPGSNYELEYAVLAFLVEKLSEFGGHKTIKRIASLLEIEISTAKERVRICRESELLTEAGKGFRGSSEITNKARKILEKEGVIDAKKGK